MRIRKFCWDTLGNLDKKAFGKGYRKESDLCMCYLAHGWKNILQPSLFIYHNHGGSFAIETKKKLLEKNLGILRERWMKYINQISSFVERTPWDAYRFSALMYQYHGVDELIIDYNSPQGGAYLYRRRQEKKFISAGKKVITIAYTNSFPTIWNISFVFKDGRGEFPVQNVMEILNIIKFLLPKHIFVNNFAFCSDLNGILAFFIGQHYSRFFDLPVSPLQPFTPGTEIKMDFISEKNNLHTIELFMATYARKNRGYLQWKLLDSDGHMIRSSEINVGQINDNRWCTICFSPITNSAGKKYQLIIKSFCKNSKNAVTCYAKQKTSDMPDEKLYINGDLQDLMLCRTFGYNTVEYFCKLTKRTGALIF